MYLCKSYEKCIITKYTKRVYSVATVYVTPNELDVEMLDTIPANRIRTELCKLGCTADDGCSHQFEIYLYKIQPISYVTIKYTKNRETSIRLEALSNNMLYGSFYFWTPKYSIQFPEIVGFRS